MFNFGARRNDAIEGDGDGANPGGIVPSVLRVIRHKHAAAVMAAALVVAGVSTFALAPSDAQPGVPIPGAVVFVEDFQNTGASTTGVSIVNYTGAANAMTYTADSWWTSAAGGCNGWITGDGLATPSDNGCNKPSSPYPIGWAYTKGLAFAMGKAQGMSDTDAELNKALTAFTNGGSQQAGTMLKTAQSIPVPGGRYYAVSAYFAAMNCQQTAGQPKENLFLLVNGTAQTLSAANKDMNPCVASVAMPGFNPLAQVKITDGTYTSYADVYVAKLYSTAYLMGSATTYNLGLQLVNNQAAYSGNDVAFDMVEIIDVTPQLDKSFSPSTVNDGQTSRLTFTITNTDDLQAKNGWSFTDTLPSGMKVATNPNMTTDCGTPTVNAGPGATSIAVTGNLNQDMASCTVNLDVTAPIGTYSNGPSNVTPMNGVSAPVDTASLTVLPVPPAITSPTDGSATRNNTPTITGTGTPDDAITVLDGSGNTVCITTADSSGNWSCTPSSALADGPVTLTATQTDPATSLISKPSSPVTVTIDTTAPGVPSITSPAEGDTVATGTPTITGTGDEPGNTIMVFDGAATVCTAIVQGDGSWSCKPSTALPDGPHKLSAVETDPVGNDSAASPDVNITVDTTAPGVPVITSPADNAGIATGTPTIKGTGAEPGNTITVMDGATTVCTATVETDNTWHCTPATALTDGPHTLTAVETDPVGNPSGPSAPVNVTVDTVAPAAPTITSPSDGAAVNTGKPVISGTGAEPGNTITVKDGATDVCTATVQPGGSWSCSPTTALTDGDHTLTATETDPVGNESAASAPVTITVDTVAPPAPAITSPSDGDAIATGTPTITGTGDEPGNAITIKDGNTVVCTTTVQAGGTWTCTPTAALPDGPHTLTAVETDPVGNASSPSPAVDITVDTTTPGAPTITSPTDGAAVNSGAPTITGTGEEPGNTITVKDGNTVICTTTVQPGGSWNCTPSTPLTDGAHTLAATETDQVGHTSAPSAPVKVTVDTTPPAAPSITVPADNTSLATGTPTITGKGAEPGNTITVKDGNTDVCSTTVQPDGTWTCTPATALPDGDHTLAATETDSVGNASVPSATVNLTVDTTAPAVPAITSPSNGDALANGTPTITGTGDEPGNTITVKDGATVVCTAVVQAGGAWTCTPTTPLTDGSHTLKATETDPVGNNSPASAPVTVTVDTTAPAAPSITSPADNTSVATGTPTITGNGAEPGNTITVKDGATDVCTAVVQAGGTWSCAPSTPLGDGLHTLTATETDPVGNASVPSAPVKVTVDTTAPAAPTITSPADNTSIATGTPIIKGNGAEPGDTITVKDGATDVCTAVVQAGGTWSCTPSSPLTDGSHTLTATETDPVGNESGPSAPVNVTVDTTAPGVPAITSPATGTSTSSNKPLITGTADEPGATITVKDGGTTVCTATVLAGGTWSCAPTAPLADGSHTFTATQTDLVGNPSGTSTPVTVTVDTTAPLAPAITSPSDGDAVGTNLPTITGTGEQPGDTITVKDGSTVVCTATVQAGGTWTCTPTAPLGDGDHTLTATETDQVGNESQPSASVKVTVDTTSPSAPWISSPSNGAHIGTGTPLISGFGAEVGNTITVKDGSTVVCTAKVQTGGTWNCTPTTPLTDGDHTLTAVETDPVGNNSPASSPVALTVDTTAPGAPTITSPSDGDAVNSGTPTITGTGAEPGNTITIKDGGLTICTATVKAGGSWSCIPTTPLTDGDHTLTATETDPVGNHSPSTSVTVTVDTTAPSAPSITSPAEGDAVNSGTPTITGTGEQPGDTITVKDGNTAICTTTVQPGGTWTCTPAIPMGDGDHTLTAVETDPVGNPSGPSAPVKVTVDTVAPAAPAITSPSDGTDVNSGSPTISGTGEVGATVTVSDGTNTICTTTVSSTGDWSCTPSAPLPDGTYALTAKQTDKAGNTSGPSNIVNLTVDTVAPNAPAITSPSEGDEVNSDKPTITGTGNEPGNTITVKDGDKVICTTTVQPDGTWTCTPSTPLDDGDHSLTATETDKAGNESVPSDPIGFGVRTLAIAIVSPVRFHSQVETVIGYHFLPGETVRLTIYSDPWDGGTQVADSNGTVTFTFNVPAVLALGDHTATLTGELSGAKSIAFKVVAVNPVVSTGGSVAHAVPAVAGGVMIVLGLLLFGVLVLRRLARREVA